MSLHAIPSLLLVGCGAMGGALLGRWLEQGLPAERVTVVDPSPRLPSGYAGRVASVEEAEPPAVLVLGIKPQGLAGAAPALRRLMGPDTLVVTMLAGLTAAATSAALGGAPVVRIMPNTPARVGRGVTALWAHGASEAQRATAQALAAAAGRALWLGAEAQFDAVTALSGSGPAYLFRFIEALAAAGERQGLAPELAATLARETVIGAALLAAESTEGPAELRRQVTSPNGVTQAGLVALDDIDGAGRGHDGGGALSQALRATLAAATKRSAELSRLASGGKA